MGDSTKKYSLHGKLERLETVMKSLRLWTTAAPSADDMASAEPFCYDTLPLEQWLQWIMIPRFRAIIESSASLPANCNVHDYAEEVFAKPAHRELLDCIKDIDSVVSDNVSEARGT